MKENKVLKKQIQKFMYTNDLKIRNATNFKLISNSYLRKILASIYSDNSKINPYCIIAGDFDKLQKFNSRYSFDEVNNCMEKCLSIISNDLPKDSILARYAGDEFLFVVPSISTKEVANDYIDKINKDIERQKYNFHNMTITLASATSKNYTSLYQMYNHADKKIYNQKAQAGKNDNSLRENIESSLDSFYTSMRLSTDYKISDEQVHKIINDAWSISSELINTYKNTGKIGEDKVASSDITFPSSIFKQEKAIALDSYLHSKDTNSNSTNVKEDELDIPNIDSLDLRLLAKSLVFDEHARAFSKDYFNNFLVNSLPDQKYNVSLMSLSGLKVSNLLNGHVNTDKMMYECYNKINSSIDNKMFHKDNPFEIKKDDCYKISLGGGNILFITPEKIKLPINEIVKNVNSNDSQVLKYVTSSSKEPILPENMQDFIQSCKLECDQKKDIIKRDIINTTMSTKILKACLTDDIRDYCENNPNYMDSDKLRGFLLTLSKSIRISADDFNRNNERLKESIANSQNNSYNQIDENANSNKLNSFNKNVNRIIVTDKDNNDKSKDDDEGLEI